MTGPSDQSYFDSRADFGETGAAKWRGHDAKSSPFAKMVVQDAVAQAREFSEDQLALNFVAAHGENLRYVAPWSKWFQWTGTRWEHETTLAAFDMARKVCREAAAQCNKPSEAKAIAKAKTVASVEQLAKSDRAFVATIDQWDADISLINAPGVTVHLPPKG
jgi:phage/plasmid-associated DNA primase